MKKNIKYIVAFFAFIVLASCSNYLDIKPEDQFLEEDVFQSKTAILGAVNGVYTNMAKDNSYGGLLTMSTLDVLAQRYMVTTSQHPFHDVSIYDYETASSKTFFNKIWVSQYANILSINNLLAGLETYPGVLTIEQENQLKGELIGLRAMLHFDILRLFGPIYSVNSSAEAIPYYTDNSGEINNFLSATDVMVKVLEDLDTAENLLANDPIIADGPQDKGLDAISEDNDKFIYSRQYRFNYYAVKALQARANLYAGNNELALTAAKFVIDNASEWFPWTTENEVHLNKDNPDRIFSKEIIFGLINTQLYSRYNNYFAPTLADNKILVTSENYLDEIYESSSDDYRYNNTWKQPASGAKSYKVFLKFADVQNNKSAFRQKQPLVKISEMYYIAAELEPDTETALTYLNTVRNNRGLSNLPNTVNMQEELLKAYKKEFYGEGQLFFYYKRLNVETLRSGTPGLASYTMTANQYVVPIPTSETDYRN